MLKILPYVPFFFVCLAIFWIITGGRMIIFPEKAIRKRDKKKEKPEPTQKDIDRARIIGVGRLVVAILLIIALKIDVGWLDRPELAHSLENQNIYEDYENVIDDFLDKNTIPGMVLGIVDENGSHLFTYGYHGVDKQKKITEDTIFEIGSASKVFTGLLLAEAVSSGSATLEETLRFCIPEEIIAKQEFYDQITLGHLTTHTSGLPRLPQTLDFTINVFVANLIGGNPYENVTREKLLSYLEQTAAPKSIGTDFEYSNYGVGLLGACLSSQKGLSYEELLRRIIMEPLGMTNTTIHLTQEQEALYTPGYRGFLRFGRFVLGMKSKPWLMGEGSVGAGGIRSSGADMLRFLEACIFEELDFISLSKTPIFQSDEEGLEIGMGWLLEQNSLEDHTVIWHNGQTGGFNSYIAFFADKPGGVFVMANTTVNIQHLGEEILSILGD